jgi:excisionase family DNA binding protein
LSEKLEITTKTYTVPQAGRVLGLSRAAAYKAVRSGEIPCLKFGSHTLRIAIATVEQMLANENTA